MHRTKGFTLLELMVAILMFSILMGIAIPSFNDMIVKNSVIAEANDLMASIMLARSEAVKREANTLLRRKNATTWEAFIDDDGDGKKDDGTPQLLEHTVNNENISLTAKGDLVNGIGFRANGRASNSGLKKDEDDYFILVRDHAPSRCIRFSLSGRPWIDKDKSEGGTCEK